MPAQGLYAISFRGVMAGRQIVQTRLPGRMHGLLRNFPAQISIDTRGCSLFDIALCRASAPGQRLDRVVAAADRERRLAQGFGQLFFETFQSKRLRKPAAQYERKAVVAVDIAFDPQTQPACELHVIAEFLVYVERQVKGDQAEIVFEQGGDALFAIALDHRALTFPEIAVMDQQRVGPGGGRAFDQFAAGSDAGNDLADA